VVCATVPLVDVHIHVRTLPTSVDSKGGPSNSTQICSFIRIQLMAFIVLPFPAEQ
jgi:hypothetical protein